MKVQRLTILFFLILLLPLTRPMNIEQLPVYKLDIYFNINENNSVSREMNYVFEKTINESIIFDIPANATVTRVTNGTEDIPFEDNGTAIITAENETLSRLGIYIASNDIFQKDSINFFFDAITLNSAEKMSAKAILPQGYVIHDRQFTPNDAIISTDGKQIILDWEADKVQGPIIFSMQFEKTVANITANTTELIQVKENHMKISALLVFLILLLIIGLISTLLYFKKKSKKEFLHGYSNLDQKAIEFLQHHKVVWQKEIQREFSLSRAGATRLVKRLEEKNLIRKEPYGRTNKIHWIK